MPARPALPILMAALALASPPAIAAAQVNEAAMVQPSDALEMASNGEDMGATFALARTEYERCRTSRPNESACAILLYLTAFSALQAKQAVAGYPFALRAVERAVADPAEAIETLPELAQSYAGAVQAAGLLEESRPLLTGMLILLSRGPLDNSSNSIADTLDSQASQLEQDGRAATAEPMRRALLALRLRQPEAAGVRRAMAAVALALNLNGQGRFDELDALFAQALAATTADTADMALVLNAEGKTLDARGRYREAEARFRQALAIQSAQPVPDDVAVSSSLNNIGHVMINQARFGEAEPLLRRALAIRVAKLGEEDAATATAYNNLGTLLVQQGRHADAEPYLRKALATRSAALGPAHPLTAETRSNLGIALLGTGRAADACSVLASAVGQLQDALGKTHPDVGIAASNAGNCYIKAGLGVVALPLYRMAAAISGAAHGERHPATLVANANLAAALWGTGETAEASTLYRTASAASDTVLGRAHPTSIALRGDLGSLELLATGQAGPALADLRDAADAAILRTAGAGRDAGLAGEYQDYRRYLRRRVAAAWAVSAQ